MMEQLQQWLVGVVLVTVLLSVAQNLLPEGNLRQTISYVGGLILLVALLQPVGKVELENLFEEASAAIPEVEGMQMELEYRQQEELEQLIAQRTGAYIWAKAAELGLETEIQVETRIGEEGVPLPYRVEIGAPLSRELSRWLEAELGIPQERQVWQNGENERN